MSKSKLPVRPVGTYTLQWYNESGDCVEREAWDNSKGGLLNARLYAQEKMIKKCSTSCTIDHRVYNSLTNTWTTDK